MDEGNSLEGIFLALYPIYDEEEYMSELEIALINNLGHNIRYELMFSLNQQCMLEEQDELAEEAIHFCGKVEIDQLNESPQIRVIARWSSEEGRQKVEKIFRIKAKTIFNGPQYFPPVEEDIYTYELYRPQQTMPIESSEPEQTEQPLNIDTELLKQMMMGDYGVSNKRHDLNDANYEIDIHLEKLIKNTSHLSNTEKLNIQLEAFERFLENAIANNMHSVIVIHGIGSGKLKSEIHQRLREHPMVKRFELTLHKAQGPGATEIFF